MIRASPCACACLPCRVRLAHPGPPQACPGRHTRVLIGRDLAGSVETSMSAYGGVRIADFSQGLAGPMAAMLLGDFEAEVVKVEPPGGDRRKDHPGYLAWNRNKQVLTLDLQTAEGLAAARELIAGADV